MAGMMHVRRLSRYLLTPIVIILVLALGVGLFFIGIPSFRRASADNQFLYKGPAASINGVKIKDEAFNQFYLPLLQNYGSTFPEEQLKEEVLKFLIDNELINQAIKDRKIKASGDEVNAFLDKIKQANPTEEQMETFFKQVGVANMKDLKKAVTEQIERQILYAQLAEEEKMEVSEEAVKERYELITAAHILIATNERLVENPPSESAALKEAQTVYAQLQEGADFAEMAKEYSDDPSNKENGGQLGTNTVVNYRNVLGEEFTNVALELKVGEVSNPVKTSAGYHLIKVTDQKLAEGEEWEKEKEVLERELLAEKFAGSEQIGAWLKKQANEAEIEIIDPALRAFRLRTEGEFPEAAQAYEKALRDKRYKNDLDTYVYTSLTYSEAEMYDEALGVLERIPEKIGDQMTLLITKARIYHTKGDEAATKENLATAVEKAGESLNDLNQILYMLREFEYEEETKAVEEKIKAIEARRAEEQKALEELYRQEQEKVEAAQQADEE